MLLEGDDHARTTADQPRTTTDQPGDRTDLLIAELQDRVRSLEEANRENRRLLAAALERIPPQLEAPESPPEAPEAATVEEAERRRPGGDQEGAQRPWWRRWFGG